MLMVIIVWQNDAKRNKLSVLLSSRARDRGASDGT